MSRDELEVLERRTRLLERELADARSAAEQARPLLAEYADLQRLGYVVASVSSELEALEDVGLDAAIVRAMGAFASETRVDAAMLGLFSRDGASLERTYVWPPETSSDATPPPTLALDRFAWTDRKIRALEVVHVPRIAELPEEAQAERVICERFGLRSALHVPLVHRGSAIGHLSLVSLATERAWSEAERSITRVLADLLASAITRRRSSGDWAKVFACLRSLGAGSRANIERLTALVGELVGATCALYNRLDEGKLCAWGRWQTPPDYVAVDVPDGHICNDVIRGVGDALVVLRDLPSTSYAKSDPNVGTYGLQTYMGRAVASQGAHVGSLCVVFRRDFDPNSEQRRLFEAVADAIAVEEVRSHAHEALEQAVGELEATLESTADGILVADTTARPLRQNRRFVEMWGLTSALEHDHEAAARHRLQAVKDPYGFLAKVAALYQDEVNHDFSTVELNDGRIFERYSIPLRVGARHRGRVWSFRDVTARVRREEELRQTLALLEGTLEATADGILVADRNARPLLQNRKFLEMWRVPPDIVHDLEAVARHRLQSVKDPFGYVAQVAELYDDETRHDLSTLELVDGRIFERYSIPLRVGGEHRGRVWSVRDVTERTRRDDELRHSIALLEATLDATADGIVVADPTGRSLRENRRFREMWRTDPEVEGDVDEQARLRLALVKDPHRFLVGRLKLYQDTTRERFATAELRDGRLLELYSLPMRVDGEYRGRVTSYRDVTERARGEASRALLATAVEQAGEAVLITDRDGLIEYVNPTFERMSGYRLADVRGQTPRVLKSDRYEPETYRALWETICAGAVWSGRLVNRRADGTLFEVDEVIAPVRTAAGEVRNFVGILRDVTREHQLEEEVRQAQKMEAVGRLAGGIAHDFNNLLTAIIGYAEMLEGALASNDPLRDDVHEIRLASDRAANLTRQLLAFSRRQVLQPRVLDLNEVLGNIGKMLQRLIPESVTVWSALHGALWTVKADPGQVEQVVLNLALNARDAMPEGGQLTLATANVTLELTTLIGHDAMPPGRYARLTVSDSGHGMDAATLARIFEPFFTTKGLGKGTGLGLATVYGIVRQSGGAIQVESAPEAGTTFQLLFPACEAATGPTSSALMPVPRSQRERTLLLVEDESSVRAVAARALRASGYRLLEAVDGVHAMELAEAHEGEIDALVTDVVMPRMSGPELARRLTAMRPSLPVLFMSGHVDASVQGRELPSGAAFLPKPFEPEALRRAVFDLLSTRGA